MKNRWVVGLSVVLWAIAGSGFGAVVMDWVTVGDPGNAADEVYGNHGAVAEIFRISKYEVTNDQYAEFLNAVAASDPHNLYNTNMDISPQGEDQRGGIVRSGVSGSYIYTVKPNMGNKPVNWISYFDAMRFVNWMHNGQGSGDTETGVYEIDTGLNETRAGNATYFIPTQDEWYKTAYYDPEDPAADDTGISPDYWYYPTQSDAGPTIATADATGNINNDTSNIANHYGGAGWGGLNGHLTTVGSGGPGNQTHYGASDMAGNVWEFTEVIPGDIFSYTRGGSWADPADRMRSYWETEAPVWAESSFSGLRIAAPLSASSSNAIPEPGTSGLLWIGGLLIRFFRRLDQ